jgi:hypothetical protein
MDIEELYNLKNSVTEKVHTNSLLDLFKSDDNINILSRLLYKNNYLSNNSQIYNNIRELVKKYINSWIQLGKFDNIQDTANNGNNDNNGNNGNNQIYIQLRYYNNLFIKTFSNNIVNDNLYKHEIDNNAYKHKFNVNNKEKTMAEFQADDYQYISSTNYNDKFTLNDQFTSDYHKIPYYEKWLYNKHYDTKDLGSLTNRALENIQPKKYNNNELLNNIEYLKKNKI